jgi:hypothetical protein
VAARRGFAWLLLTAGLLFAQFETAEERAGFSKFTTTDVTVNVDARQCR